MSLTFKHIIRVLEEIAEIDLAPKNVGNSVGLSATRRKVRGLADDLRFKQEMFAQSALERADIAAHEEEDLA